jgi:hypothetical protein
MRSRKSAFFRQYPEIDFLGEEAPNPMTMRNFDPSSLSEEEADETASDIISALITSKTIRTRSGSAEL